MREVLSTIASKFLGIPSLKDQGSDSANRRFIHIPNLDEALEEAFNEGYDRALLDYKAEIAAATRQKFSNNWDKKT